MIQRVLPLTSIFQAGRNNVLNIICCERAAFDNRITITPGFSLSDFMGGTDDDAVTEQMDEISDCFQRMDNRSANMQQPHLGMYLVLCGGGSRRKQLKVCWSQGLCIFTLSCKVASTLESPTNLLQIQAIITRVWQFLKRDEHKEDKSRRQRTVRMRKVFAAPRE